MSDWRAAAACKGKGTLFFPLASGASYQAKGSDPYAAARKICATCPSREPCLEYALVTPGQTDGLWGGCDEAERRRIKRVRLLARRAS